MKERSGNVLSGDGSGEELRRDDLGWNQDDGSVNQDLVQT